MLHLKTDYLEWIVHTFLHLNFIQIKKQIVYNNCRSTRNYYIKEGVHWTTTEPFLNQAQVKLSKAQVTIG